MPEPIAIVGMAAKFPSASNLSELWNYLRSGSHPFSDDPQKIRLDPAKSTGDEVTREEKAYFDELWQFDAEFFGIPERAAEQMDPQQRMLLETVVWAFHDAGIPTASLAARDVGIYVGAAGNGFRQKLFRNLDSVDEYTDLGYQRRSVIAWLTAAFDIEGPGTVFDSGAASSLTAVHHACEGLRSGEVELAVAGGANVEYGFEAGRPEGEGKRKLPPGEGAGAVVLKRADKAREDGDRIWAILERTAISTRNIQSGSTEENSASRTVTETDSNEEQTNLQFLEMNGSVSTRGLQAWARTVEAIASRAVEGGEPILVGCVGSNLGELKAASGVASLIKAAFVLRRRVYPRTPEGGLWSSIDPQGSAAIRAPKTAVEFPPGQSLKAAVYLVDSSGIEVGARLSAPPSDSGVTNRRVGTDSLVAEAGPYLVPLSAHTPDALVNRVRDLRAVLGRRHSDLDGKVFSPPDCSDEARFESFLHTVGSRSDHFAFRRGFVASSRRDLLEELDQYSKRWEQSPDVLDLAPTLSAGSALVFRFGGLEGMLEFNNPKLLECEPFFEFISSVDGWTREHIDWSVLERMREGRGAPELESVTRTSVYSFAVQGAIASFLRKAGIEPDFVTGDALGQFIAAYVAGIFELKDVLQIIVRRAELIERDLCEETRSAVVANPVSEVETVLQGTPAENETSISAVKGPTTIVVSGTKNGIEEVLLQFQARGTFSRLLPRPFGLQTGSADSVGKEMDSYIKDSGIEVGEGEVPLVTPFRGEEGGKLVAPDATFVGRSVTASIDYITAVEKLVDLGGRCFVDFSSETFLNQTIQDVSKSRSESVRMVSLNTGDRMELSRIMGVLARLYEAGYEPDWGKILPVDDPLSLPAYPFNRKHLWIGQNNKHGGRREFERATAPSGVFEVETMKARPYNVDRATQEVAAVDRADLQRNPLSRRDDSSSVRSATREVERFHSQLRSLLSKPDYPFALLRISASVSASAELLERVSSRVSEISRESDLVYRGGADEFFLCLRGVETPGEMFRVANRFSNALRASNDNDLQGVDISIHMIARPRDAGRTPDELFEELRAQPQLSDPTAGIEIMLPEEQRLTGEEFYEFMDARGITYGPEFQRVQWLSGSSRFLRARVSTQQSSEEEGREYANDLYPPVFDALLHVAGGFLAIRPEFDQARLLMPIGIESVEFFGEFEGDLLVNIWPRDITLEGAQTTLMVDGVILSESGETILTIAGLRLRAGTLRKEYNFAGESRMDWLNSWSWAAVESDERTAGEPASEDEEEQLWIVGGTDEEWLSEFRAASENEVDNLSVLELPISTDEGPGSEEVAETGSLARQVQEEVEQIVDEHAGGGQPGCHFLYLIESTEDLDNRVANTAELGRRLAAAGAHLTEIAVGLDEALVEIDRLDVLSHGGGQRPSAGEAPDSRSVTTPDAWGALVRAIKNEMPNLQVRHIEVDSRIRREEFERLRRIVAVDEDSTDLMCSEDECVASRYGKWKLNDSGKAGFVDSSEARKGRYEIVRRRKKASDGWETRARHSGRRSAESGECEVSVEFCGLGASERSATGGNSDLRIGYGGVGTIEGVGEGCERIEPGQRVVFIQPEGGAATGHTVVDERCVVALPDDISPALAAAEVVPLTTVYSVLTERIHVEPGDRVLLLGVDPAYVRAAGYVLEELGATCVANADRNLFSESSREHITFIPSDPSGIDGSQLEQYRTNGADVVWYGGGEEHRNVAFEAVREGGGLIDSGGLAEGGINLPPSFIEGRRSFHRVELPYDLHGKKCGEKSVWHEVIRRLSGADWRSDKIEGYPSERFPEAVESVVEGDEITAALEISHASFPIEPNSEGPPEKIFEDGIYLVTGGTGGIGFELFAWLDEWGAGEILLLSRRGEESLDELQHQRLDTATSKVKVFEADVANRGDLERVFAYCEESSRTLRGIFHLAGVTEDRPIQNQDVHSFQKAIRPKVVGALYLHQLSEPFPIDHFVAFSSISGIVGMAGQANYSMANAWLDRFAIQRTRAGKRALSIAWGGWSGIGMLHRNADKHRHVTHRGLKTFEPEEAREIFEHLLRQEVQGQIGVAPANWREMSRQMAAVRTNSFVDFHPGEDPEMWFGDDKERSIRDRIRSAVGRDQKLSHAERLVEAAFGDVTGLTVSARDFGKSGSEIGIDSLMAVEIANRIEDEVDVTIESDKVLSGDLSAIASQIVDGIERNEPQ